MKKMMNLQTKDVVAEAIRNEILSGGIEAGEELKQELLAEMLGVSRMPVREALQLLEQEGYIERLPNRHMVVADLGAEKIRGIMGMIAAMETEIVLQGCGCGRWAGDGGGEHGGNEPERLLAAMKNAIDDGYPAPAAEYELDYHYSLVRLLGITYIEQLFNKALGGYVSYIIRQRTGGLAERYRLLRELEHKRQEAAPDQFELEAVVRSYYQELFESWNRKE